MITIVVVVVVVKYVLQTLIVFWFFSLHFPENKSLIHLQTTLIINLKESLLFNFKMLWNSFVMLYIQKILFAHFISRVSVGTYVCARMYSAYIFKLMLSVEVITICLNKYTLKDGWQVAIPSMCNYVSNYMSHCWFGVAGYDIHEDLAGW